MYKAKNQLRGWKSFKKSTELQRYLKNIAKMEAWFNAAPLLDAQERLVFLGYLKEFIKLVDATMEVCASTFGHYHHQIERALFVQQAIAIISIVARIDQFLGRLRSEAKYEAEVLESKLNGVDGAPIIETEKASEIMVMSNLKDGKRPFAGPAGGKKSFNQHQNKAKKQKQTTNISGKPSNRTDGDEIDDIFGSF